MSDDDFFKKAAAAKKLHEQALKEGRKLGTWQDKGVFFGPDAPASLRNQLMPLELDSEWEARVARQAVDSIVQKFGPGTTIMDLFYDPLKGANAMPGDPPSEAMKRATPEEVRTLWDKWFAMHRPQYKHGPYTPKFTAALKAEAERRGVTLVFA